MQVYYNTNLKINAFKTLYKIYNFLCNCSKSSSNNIMADVLEL